MSDITSKNVTIHVATDHAGLSHKELVKSELEELGYVVVDHGAVAYDELDDFPDYIAAAAKAVSGDAGSKGIIFGGSGQGEAMMANRYKGVRAAVFYGGEEDIVKLSREHNDANVLSIGARFVSLEDTKRIVIEWLQMDANTDEKYLRRNKKLDELA